MIKYIGKGIYELKTVQELPISLKESWSFFSNPKNLFKITPEHMNFSILTDFNKIYEGQIIKYKVSPFPFFRVGWTTKITTVEEPFNFIISMVAIAKPAPLTMQPIFPSSLT